MAAMRLWMIAAACVVVACSSTVSGRRSPLAPSPARGRRTDRRELRLRRRHGRRGLRRRRRGGPRGGGRGRRRRGVLAARRGGRRVLHVVRRVVLRDRALLRLQREPHVARVRGRVRQDGAGPLPDGGPQVDREERHRLPPGPGRGVPRGPPGDGHRGLHQHAGPPRRLEHLPRCAGVAASPRIELPQLRRHGLRERSRRVHLRRLRPSPRRGRLLRVERVESGRLSAWVFLQRRDGLSGPRDPGRGLRGGQRVRLGQPVHVGRLRAGQPAPAPRAAPARRAT